MNFQEEKQTCVQCHFLYGKSVFAEIDKKRHKSKDPLTQEERDKIIKEDFRWLDENVLTLACYLEVFDENHNREGIEWSKIDRKGFCYFWKYTPGMILQGAKELQKRAAENEKFEKQIKRTNFGLLLAGIGLLLNAIFGAINIWLKYK